MNAHGRHTFFLGAHHHGLQVIDVAVHIAVGKQTDEVQHAAPGLGPCNDLLPGLALPDGAFGDGIGDQSRTLGIHLAGADGIVADFGIAHVVIGGHANGSPVRTQTDVRGFGEEAVQIGFAGSGNGAPDIGLRQAVAVHDDHDNRPGNTGEGGKLFKHGGLPERAADRRPA